MIERENILKDSIYVVKNFPSRKEQSDFWYFANESDYAYGANNVNKKRMKVTDSHMGKRQGRFTHHFNPDEFVKTSFWQRIDKSVDYPLGLLEAYINYGDSSTLAFPHCDNREDNMSILMSLNQYWHRNWGGYTVFFEGVASNEIIKTVVPEPGKAIFFNGAMYHSALPPNVTAEYPRFMLALKTVWMENERETEKEEI